MTYNIQYGTGLSNHQKYIDKKGAVQRLDAIANAIRKADPDIVFMQEVDFCCSRSHKINQAKYLAKKGGYPFFAIAPHWKKRLFPDLYGRHGPLNHGLCILSRFPLKKNQSQPFPLLKSLPFFISWLYNPHGAQKVEALIGEKRLTLVNVHLDPWSAKEREQQIQKVLRWIQENKEPIVIAGDFNLEPSETITKQVSHLTDIPWFISLEKEDLEQEKTLESLKKNGFSTVITKQAYINHPSIYYTFPSHAPEVTLDYVFISQKIQTINAQVFKEASKASDHLPILTEIKLP